MLTSNWAGCSWETIVCSIAKRVWRPTSAHPYRAFISSRQLLIMISRIRHAAVTSSLASTKSWWHALHMLPWHHFKFTTVSPCIVLPVRVRPDLHQESETEVWTTSASAVANWAPHNRRCSSLQLGCTIVDTTGSILLNTFKSVL